MNKDEDHRRELRTTTDKVQNEEFDLILHWLNYSNRLTKKINKKKNSNARKNIRFQIPSDRYI